MKCAFRNVQSYLNFKHSLVNMSFSVSLDVLSDARPGDMHHLCLRVHYLRNIGRVFQRRGVPKVQSKMQQARKATRNVSSCRAAVHAMPCKDVLGTQLFTFRRPAESLTKSKSKRSSLGSGTTSSASHERRHGKRSRATSRPTTPKLLQRRSL